MDAHALLAELDLGSKPWFQRHIDAAHITQALTGPATRENWKYTPIGPFVDAYVAHCAKPAPATPLPMDGGEQSGISLVALQDLTPEDRLIAQEALANLDPVRYPLAELSALHNKSGYLIKITGSVAEPLRIRHVDSERLLLIDVASNANVCLIETSEEEDFGNTTTVLNLRPGSRVNHSRCALRATPMHLSLLSAHLADNATYELQQYLVGGRKRRTDCHILLAGRNASTAIIGAFVTEDGNHLDQQLVVEHKAPHTTSTQTFHGIGRGNSRSVFNGRIHIHPGASGADAQLRNKNLSLDPGADINTKPELEIYTDDVKCAHGATVGQLDADQLFYLRCRGLAEAQARSLLCSAFIRSCIQGPLTEAATRRLTECLA